VEKIVNLVGNVVCYDAFPNHEWIKKMPNARYVKTVDELLAESHIITVHVPLLPSTKHLLNKDSIEK
jgi:lactate dehydrogenase-like 2-hydroxyacid dehydrogenase